MPFLWLNGSKAAQSWKETKTKNNTKKPSENGMKRRWKGVTTLTKATWKQNIKKWQVAQKCCTAQHMTWTLNAPDDQDHPRGYLTRLLSNSAANRHRSNRPLRATVRPCRDLKMQWADCPQNWWKLAHAVPCLSDLLIKDQIWEAGCFIFFLNQWSHGYKRKIWQTEKKRYC